jgi:hypothetical protein
VRHLNGSTENYFSYTEIELALRITAEGQRRGAALANRTGSKADSMSQK